MADNFEVTVIPVHSSQVRGITGGIMAAASEADRIWFAEMMAQGMTKADALDRLVSRMSLRAGATIKRGVENR